MDVYMNVLSLFVGPTYTDRTPSHDGKYTKGTFSRGGIVMLPLALAFAMDLSRT